MAQDEGRRAEGQESCHSVEVNTIFLMPLFFVVFFSIFLPCIVTVHTISFEFNSSEDFRYSVLASVVKTLFTQY